MAINPTLRDWLASACNNASAVIPLQSRRESPNHYGLLVRETQIEQWRAFTREQALDTISRLPNGGLHQHVTRARPLVNWYEKQVPNEQAWVLLLSQTLLYHVKVALDELGQPDIAIGTYWPFKRAPLRSDSLRRLQDYIPDYTVGIRDPGTEPRDIDPREIKALVIGDAKLRRHPVSEPGPANPTTPSEDADEQIVPGTQAMSRSDLGQLLHYCTGKGT